MLPRKKIQSDVERSPTKIKLHPPTHETMMSIEEVLRKRESTRIYLDKELTLQQISYLLWAAQGMRNSNHRVAPSAGGTYPIELYIVVRNVEKVPQGVYKYVPKNHVLVKILKDDIREKLCDATLGQKSVENAPAVIIICAVYERTTAKYGERGERYVHMEAGHVAQNVYLQTAALNLGTVVIGAFDDATVQKAISAKPEEKPLYIMPLGRKAS